MAKLHLHPVGLVLLFFGFLVWIVALGGLAATTNVCLTGGPYGNEGTAAYCSRTYQLEWWSIWFEFFLLIVMLITCFLNAFERARFIYLTYLSLVTSILTIGTRNFINATVLSFVDAGGKIVVANTKQSANNAAAAGLIMLCMVNYALIVFIGLGASAAQQAKLAMESEVPAYKPSAF